MTEFVMHVCHMGELPQLPSNSPPGLNQVVEECWERRPRDRPTSAELLRRLQEIFSEPMNMCIERSGDSTSDRQVIISVKEDESKVDGPTHGIQPAPLTRNVSGPLAQ